jgi:hypothetical protein
VVRRREAVSWESGGVAGRFRPALRDRNQQWPSYPLADNVA